MQVKRNGTIIIIISQPNVIHIWLLQMLDAIIEMDIINVVYHVPWFQTINLDE